MKRNAENCTIQVSRVNGMGNTKKEIDDNDQQKIPHMKSESLFLLMKIYFKYPEESNKSSFTFTQKLTVDVGTDIPRQEFTYTQFVSIRMQEIQRYEPLGRFLKSGIFLVYRDLYPKQNI